MVSVYPMFFSWELNVQKLLVVKEVGGANFHGFIFICVRPREDEFFENFKSNKAEGILFSSL